MEYRGYDSAGVAVIWDQKIELRKKAGKIGNLEAELPRDPLPDTQLGIGHHADRSHR
jgi:glucosamine--fructose-6-phosphate aminotransferase (isomerizing)